MTLGLKYKLVTLIFWGARHHLISYTCTSVPDAYSQCTYQFIFPYAHDQHVVKGPVKTRKFYAYAEQCTMHRVYTHQFLKRMLSKRISSWPVCIGYTSVPDAYAQHLFKGAVSRDFWLLVFQESVSPQVPEYTSKAVSNFFENSRRYSQLKMHHQCHWHRWQMEKSSIIKVLILLFGHFWEAE